MPSEDDLRRILSRIDGRGYKAYREIRGSFDFGPFTLTVDHVQGDPFAAPSKLRVRVAQSEARLPASLFRTPVRRVAFADYLARRVDRAIGKTSSGRRGSGKSGLISVDAGGQQVLERTAIRLDAGWAEVRLEAGLPAAGRRVLGREATEMLCRDLPEIARRSLFWSSLPQDDAVRFVELVENQEHSRDQLEDLGLVAFVGDGAILPRESGASDRPLRREAAVPFQSPESLRVHLRLANPIAGREGPLGEIAGMGIREGVTLIVGGGYHGKSTLLRALERAVYPHVPGDGREWVVSRRDLVKIRSEDGRRVEQVDISAFIRNLPQGRSTAAFSSDDASGSTSQASNILEAIEVGAKGLLLDEDTSATNFMVRDARMQALVSREHEPITPFLERVRELHDALGVSTVLVMGGCGDYLDVANCVIAFREFQPREATREAREIASQRPTGRRLEAASELTGVTQRIPLPESFDASRGRREVKIDARDLDQIRFGNDDIDLRHVDQIVDHSQTRAVGFAIHLVAQRFLDGEATLREAIERLEEFFDRDGLDQLDPFGRPGRHPGNFARPRRFEIAAAINRLRSLRVTQRGETR
jgi:predicted ABC-class ATPase